MLLTISLSGLLVGQLKDDYVVSISSIRFFLEEENKFIHSLNTFSGTGYDGPLTWFSGECGCSVMEWLSWLSCSVTDHGKENIGFSDHTYIMLTFFSPDD